jgi:uncharacterized protein YpmB
MSPSRAESRSRLASMSIGRWIFVIAGFLLFLAVLFMIYIRSVDSGYRGEQKRAMALAQSQAGLTRIDGAVQYTWEETVWVVRGRDRDKQSWIVWERKDGLVKEKESDNFSMTQMRDRFAAEHPSAKSIRILPGWFNNQPVWEIRYDDRASSTRHPSISFYSFKDGSLLNTYVLPGY